MATCGDTSGLQQGAPWPMRGRCPSRISRTDVVGPATPHLGFYVTLGQFPYDPAIISSPTVDKDGTIYVGTQGVGTFGGGLVALWPDGGIRWFHDSGNQEMRAGGTITADNAVISAATDGTIFSFDLDGGINWSLKPTNYAISDAPLIGPDGTIYLGDQNGDFFAVHPDGGLYWSIQPGLGAIFGGATLGSDGNILVSDSSTVWSILPMAARCRAALASAPTH
jgi:outer membrane protein assembly factor BamB